MPTPPKFKEAELRDFKVEKVKRTALIEELVTQKDTEDWKPHPTLGKLKKEPYGKMQYKHLDHHFRHSGVSYFFSNDP